MSYFSIGDMFKVSGVGICSKRDNIVFQDSREKLKELLNDFATKSKEEIYRKYDISEDSRDWKLESAMEAVKENKDNLDDFIMQCHYRPFDLRWTYYINKSRAFMAYPVYNIFKHFLPSDSSLQDLPNRGNPQNGNVGLVCDRGCDFQEVDNFFVTDKITDLHLIGGGSYIFPLHLKDKDSQSENFTPQFRTFIDKKYGEKFAPEVIFGYIYAILYHKDYREKFALFLRIDYPKIPFAKSKEKFLTLSKLGRQLIDLHLMTHKLESISEPRFANLQNRNEQINKDKVSYNAEQKRLFVNVSLYFDNVSAEVWEYKIGGYQVLDKYLDSHKGEIINAPHFEQIITTLHKSLELESKITKVAIE